MADLSGDYDLERARIELEISQQEHNIRSIEFRKLQLRSEEQQCNTNIEAAKAAVEELRSRLKGIRAPDAVKE